MLLLRMAVLESTYDAPVIVQIVYQERILLVVRISEVIEMSMTYCRLDSSIVQLMKRSWGTAIDSISS
jgi:hypothetical protein